MILLLGASGYIGRAFLAELKKRGWDCLTLSRHDVDYTSFPVLVDFLRRTRPHFVINAAGFTGRPNVDACEARRAETLLGNVMLPLTVAHACAITDIPWGHVSSGCIYNGANLLIDGEWRIEPDLSPPAMRDLFHCTPERFRGFTESDEPNFTFRSQSCSFYSGTKALGEEVVRGIGQSYIWRLRIPFDENDDERNYITKLLRYPRIYQNINSLSHRGDFVRTCLDLWAVRAPFGVYNVTNPGAVSTAQVIDMIRCTLQPAREFSFWRDDAEFYRLGAATPRSNCILDVSRLIAEGVVVRPVQEALRHALENWRGESL